MALINGEYILERNENFKEYLLAIGVPEQYADLADTEKPTLEVFHNENNIKMESTSKLPNSSSTLVIGEEISEDTPIGKLKTSTSFENNVITASYAIAGETGNKIYTFTDTGINLTLTSSKPGVPEAKRFYKRI